MHFQFTAYNGLYTIETTTNLYVTLRENQMTLKHKLGPEIN